jgi:hypothetical protein
MLDTTVSKCMQYGKLLGAYQISYAFTISLKVLNWRIPLWPSIHIEPLLTTPTLMCANLPKGRRYIPFLDPCHLNVVDLQQGMRISQGKKCDKDTSNPVNLVPLSCIFLYLIISEGWSTGTHIKKAVRSSTLDMDTYSTEATENSWQVGTYRGFRLKLAVQRRAQSPIWTIVFLVYQWHLIIDISRAYGRCNCGFSMTFLRYSEPWRSVFPTSSLKSKPVWISTTESTKLPGFSDASSLHTRV